MKFSLAAISILFTLASCAQPQKKPLTIPLGSDQKSPNEAVAYFAEGCFWHAEIVFQSLTGVRDAVSGYAGGTTKNPSYEAVGTGSTGHTETVQVFYDPQKISYATLVNAFFSSQDPTELNRQGNDVGTQYRSAAFYSSNSEKQILEAAIKDLTAAKKYSDKIVTQVAPFTNFYPAEAYHQEYIAHNGNNPYVQHVSIPDYLRFRNVFKGNFKL